MNYNVPLTELGTRTWKRIKAFKQSISIGDKVWMPLDIMAMEYDFAFADGLWFKVVKKYEHHALVERYTPLGDIHRQSVTYTNLWMYCKVKKPDGRRLYGKDKE